MGIITHKLEEYKTLDSINSLVSKINDKLPKESRIYPNQMKCAIEGLRMFDGNFPRPNHLVVKGKTQAGKTGVLTSMIMLIDGLNIEEAMNVKTIYYITGDNGCRLIKQTRERISSCFTTDGIKCNFKCLKNSDLKKDINNKQELCEAIVFIDESHYGSKEEKNILIQWLKSKGINMHNDKELVDKSVYIVSNSATPYGEMNSDCGKYKSYVVLETDDWNGECGYVGFKEYNANGCFRPITSQINRTNVEEICEEWLDRLNEIYRATGKKKCGIIRMSTKAFPKYQEVLEKDFHIETFVSTNANNINYAEIEKLMEHHYDDWWPKPLIIVVAGAYRMGVSIPPYCKKNIGFVFDYVTQTDNVISTEQGILGRITGYWETDDWCDITIYINEKHYNGLKECYVKQASSTPNGKVKTIFEEKEDGKEVGFIPKEEGFIEIPCDEKFDGKEYNKKIKEYLEGPKGFAKIGKALPEGIIFIPGRRNSKGDKNHRKQPNFDKDEDGAKAILRKEENIGKECYTILYEEDEDIIKVKYGKIAKGDNKKIFEEIKKIVPTMTT